MGRQLQPKPHNFCPFCMLCYSPLHALVHSFLRRCSPFSFTLLLFFLVRHVVLLSSLCCCFFFFFALLLSSPLHVVVFFYFLYYYLPLLFALLLSSLRSSTRSFVVNPLCIATIIFTLLPLFCYLSQDLVLPPSIPSCRLGVKSCQKLIA